MKFSVLMSVYAKEDPTCLKDSLQSIFDQTLQADEVVVVKDGPLTPALEEVIGNFERRHTSIKIVALKVNQGLGVALNAGLKACSHEYVARMDSDDVSTSTRFEKQVGYITNHPEVDMIGSDIVEYDEMMKEVLAKRSVPNTHDAICKLLSSRTPFNHVSVIFNKQAVIGCGSYEDVPYFEDYYLWCKLAKAGCTFYNLPESLVKVRAGKSMAKRRGGLHYIKCIYGFEIKIYKLNIINTPQLINNLAKRIIFAVTPNNLRTYMYAKLLREEQ